MDDLITPDQLAERWHASTNWLANQRCAGVGVPYLKLGRKVVYRMRDVLAYEDASAVEIVAA